MVGRRLCFSDDRFGVRRIFLEGLIMMKQEQYFGKYNYDNYVLIVEKAKANNHPHWVGDIPVVKEVVKFFNEIRYKRPDIVPSVDVSRKGDYFGGVGLAYKDSPDIYVGALFIEVDDDGKIIYGVKSERIKNEKYNDHKDEYHIKKTKDFAKAVKTALQYVKPMSVQELMDDAESTLAGSLARMRDKPENTLYQAADMGRTVIRQEIDNMIRTGYVPITEKFREAVKLMEEQGEELIRIVNYKPKKMFVWIKPDRVEYQPHTGEPVIAYKLEDVPEEIRNKVAVLQIGDKGHAVMDVGVMVTPTTFWVFE